MSGFVLSAEHATLTLAAPNPSPRPGEGLDIVPGYSDATVFLHDVLYGLRGDRVEAAWPLLGRGRPQ